MVLQLETHDHRPEAASKRVLCTEIKNHPFDTRVIFGVLEAHIQPNHPLSRLVQFLTKYENDHLFLKYDPTSKGMRRALGWTQSGQSALSPEDAEKLRTIDNSSPIQKDAWDKLCSLFTAYRLIDTFTAYGSFIGAPTSMQEAVNEPWKRSSDLNEAAVKNIKGWDKLGNWGNVLSQARTAMASVQSRVLENPISSETLGDSPHLRHLAGLSKRNVCHKYTYILDNFQAAAMHLSYIMKMPGKEVDGILPDIPEKLDDLLNVPNNGLDTDPLSYSGVNDKETREFLAGTSALQLRLPLQYTFSISPLCLFFTFPLHKTHCDRSALLKAARGLGNMRPSELRDVEKEILMSLVHISSKPMDLKTEIQRLVSSETWQRLEALPSSDPAFCFFDLTIPQSLESCVEKNPSPPHLLESTYEKAPLRPTSDKPNRNVAQPFGDSTSTNLGEVGAERVYRSIENGIPAAVGASSQAPCEGSMLLDLRNNDANEEGDVGCLISQHRSVGILDDVAIRTEMNGGLDVPGVGGVQIEEEDVQPLTCRKTEGQKNTKGGGVPLQQCKPRSGKDGTADDNSMAVEGSVPAPTRQSARIRMNVQNEVGTKAADATENIDMDSRPAKKTKKNPTTKNQTRGPVAERPNGDDGVSADIIDVDLWTPIPVTLNVDHEPLKVEGNTICAHGPTGEASAFVLQAHDHQTLYIIQRLWRQVESAYESGKPLHVSNPQKSGFTVMTREQAAGKSSEDWLSTLKTRNVIITSGDCEDKPFITALQELGAPNTVMTIQDQSIQAHDDYNKRCLQGTFSQILKASQSPTGKILNALDIGLPFCGLNETPYASNVSALRATRGQWRTTKPVPMEEVTWALAATAGAFHTWHIDSNGFTTFVSPVCGSKLWIIGRPRDNTAFEDFADTNIYLTEFGIDKANEGLWAIEAVLLKPGDMLIMRPNTPHAVYTPTATVAHGGHCYSSSNLQESLVGMVHAFIVNALITNTNHLSARFYLQQMIAFFHLALVQDGLYKEDHRKVHVPDCTVAPGFIDLMAICMFGILINVLDFATYQYPGALNANPTKIQREEMIEFDINALSEEERHSCTYTRGQALEILAFVEKNFKFKHENDLSKWQSVRDYHEEMIIEQCQMLYNYKLKAKKQQISGAPGCSLELLRVQLSGVLDGKMNTKISESLKSTTKSQMRLPVVCGGLTPVKSAHPKLPIKSDPMAVGISLRDRLYRDRERIKSERQEYHLSPPAKRKKN